MCAVDDARGSEAEAAPSLAAERDTCGVCGGRNLDVGCDGACFSGLLTDCNGVCGGGAVADSCGVCAGGDRDVGCDGVCFSLAKEDCRGVCNGDAVRDDCGVCGAWRVPAVVVAQLG